MFLFLKVQDINTQVPAKGFKVLLNWVCLWLTYKVLRKISPFRDLQYE